MTAAQGFLATDAVLEGQESRNSLKNSLFAGNLAGDWSGQDCVASHPFMRLARLPKKRESGPEIRALHMGRGPRPSRAGSRS
jgi:hypothetical protein